MDRLNKNLSENKNIKTHDEAMKRAGIISKRNTTGKYFVIETIDSDKNHLGFSLNYKLNLEKVKDDERLNGSFIIQTNEEKYEDEKLIQVYKNLNKVENTFRIIKHDLDIRPMYHWKEKRVKGHVYVSVIAYFLMMAIEYTAPKKSYNKTARVILQELRKIHLIDIKLPDGNHKYSLTTIDADLKELLRIYKIKKNEQSPM